jgi:hypothetical protein
VVREFPGIREKSATAMNTGYRAARKMVRIATGPVAGRLKSMRTYGKNTGLRLEISLKEQGTR